MLKSIASIFGAPAGTARTNLPALREQPGLPQSYTQAPGSTTGTDCGGGYGQARRKRTPPEPVFETKGPLRWVDQRAPSGDDFRAYDGNGRFVYFVQAAARRGRFELHWAPSGTVWDETHTCLGIHFRSADDAMQTAREDHIGRSGGRGY